MVDVFYLILFIIIFCAKLFLHQNSINTNIDKNEVEEVKIFKPYGIVYCVDQEFDKPQIPINFVIEDVEGEEKIDGYTFNKDEAMGEFLNLDLSKKDRNIYSKLISWLCSTNERYFKKINNIE